jgi:hypothetical protein
MGYVGSGVDCRPSTICDSDNGGCHTEAKCESTGTTSRTCTCNAAAGYDGDGVVCTGPHPEVAAAFALAAERAASARALAGLTPIPVTPPPPPCRCPVNKPCKHDQAMVCYPMGILWGKKFCWHGTSNCRKDETTEPAQSIAGSRQETICGSGSCPAATPCKHNRAPNCYPFQFLDSRPPTQRCFHGTTYCPPL